MPQFGDLSPDEQAAYRLAARHMLRLAGAYAVPIIFGDPAWKRQFVGGATGTVLCVGTEHFVITAAHVLAGYEAFAPDHPDAIWQVGNLGFDPSPRVVARDSVADIVALAVTAEEAKAIGTMIASSADGWPPPTPIVGQAVFMSGYPKSLRDTGTLGRIGSDALSMLLRIDSIGEDYFYCQVEREALIDFNEERVFPEDTEFGGWSGAPILLMGELTYPIIGVVSEFQGNYGLLRAARLSVLEESIRRRRQEAG